MHRGRAFYGACCAVVGCLFAIGCAGVPGEDTVSEIAMSDMPRELQKMSLPDYRVEPPDILLIEAVNNIRPASDKLRAGDQLVVQVGNTPPVDPASDEVLKQFRYITGTYPIRSDGTIDLGPVFKAVKVEGMTVSQARAAIDKHLRDTYGLKMPAVSVSLPDMAGKQAISGEHLVRPDGTISLGIYGSVNVAGMTLNEVKGAVERTLVKYLYHPEVNVDVLAYNSKVYYVITDGGGFGEQIARLPVTGNETVLDAISQIQGLSQTSSKKIWIARPAPAEMGHTQILNVNWQAIAAEGITTTNYQILPGDRIYIQADHMIAIDNFVSKVTAPVERIMGIILLGAGVQQTLRFIHIRRGGGGGVGGGF